MQHTAYTMTPGSDAGEDEIDLGQIAATLWRGKWFLALCMIIAIGLGGVYAFVLATPKYAATASVILQEQKPAAGLGALAAGLDSSGAGAVSGLLGGASNGVDTEMEIIQSRPLLESLVTKLNLTEDPEFNLTLLPPDLISQAITLLTGMAPKILSETEILHATASEVRDALNVSDVKGTSIFNVSILTENPEKSALITNTLVDLYIQERTDKSFDRNEEYIRRLANRVSELEEELQLAEAAIADFNSDTDLISLQAFEGMNRQLKELRERKRETERLTTELNTRLSEVRSALEAEDFTKVAELAEDTVLKSQLDAVLSGAEAAKEQFAARTEALLAQMAQDLVRNQQQISTLEASIAQVNAKIDAQSTEVMELKQLSREAGSNQVIYNLFVGRLKGSAGELGIAPSSAEVLAPAIVPIKPAAPRKALILAFSMVLGLMVGAAILLLRQMRRTGIRSARDLENATALPVLGQMPKIPVRRRSGVFRYLVDKPNSAAAEAVRDLRTSLLLSNIDAPPQVLTITSSLPGEGKTTQALALARNLAGLGKKTLLIEGDIRNRVFGEYFSTPSQKGILSVLAGDATLDTAIARIDMLECDVLIGEQSSANAADVFSSKKFQDMLGELRKRYDAIIIDTPPVLVVPDARVIARVTDAVLYVVKWDSTSAAQVHEGLKLFHAVNIPVTGLVLSQVDTKEAARDGAYGQVTSSPYYQN